MNGGQNIHMLTHAEREIKAVKQFVKIM